MSLFPLDLKSRSLVYLSSNSPPPLLPLGKSKEPIQVIKKIATVTPPESVSTTQASNLKITAKTAHNIENSKKQKLHTPKKSAVTPESSLISPIITNGPNKQNQRMDGNSHNVTNELDVETIYIADGLAEDCEDLIERCLNVYKLNFEKFSEIWKQMDFACIFHKRPTNAELAELSEEAIFIAKKYLVSQNKNFDVKVTGLFLVYAFLNLQPYKQFAALRLIPEDVPVIKAFEMEARRQQRHDVLYILGHVLIKGPCQFHLGEREVGIEAPIKKYFDGTIRMKNAGLGVLKKTHETVPLLKELVTKEEELQNMKKAIERRHKTSNLCLAKHHAAGLLEELSHLIGARKITTKSDPPSVEEYKVPEINRHELVKSIKNKAMSNLVESMKHLTGINERQNDKSLNSPRASGINKDEITTEDSPSRSKGTGKGGASSISFPDLFTNTTETAKDGSPIILSCKDLPILNMDDECENANTVNVHMISATEHSSATPIVENDNNKANSITETPPSQPRAKRPSKSSIAAETPAKALNIPPSPQKHSCDKSNKNSSKDTKSHRYSKRHGHKAAAKLDGVNVPLSELMKTEHQQEDSIIEAELESADESHSKIINMIYKITNDKEQPIEGNTVDEDEEKNGIQEFKVNVEGLPNVYPIKKKSVMVKNENIGTVCTGDSKMKSANISKKPVYSESPVLTNKSSTEKSPTKSKLKNKVNIRDLIESTVTNPAGSKQSDSMKSPGVSKQSDAMKSPGVSKQLNSIKSPVLPNKNSTVKNSPKESEKISETSKNIKKSTDESKQNNMKSPAKESCTETSSPKRSKAELAAETSSRLHVNQLLTCSMHKPKKELKRIRIKSKFKRLGILSVANFKESTDDS